MNYRLVKSSSFLRKAKKLLKNNPDLAKIFREVLLLLEKEPFNSKLKTHQLRGSLKGSYACSLTYEIRIIFEILANEKNENENIIFLQTIGDHDEVY